jgi:hypothetical protein
LEVVGADLDPTSRVAVPQNDVITVL